MPQSLADGRRRFYILPERPIDIHKITLAEFTAGKIASANVMAQGYRFGPQDSETFAEKPLEVEGNIQNFGAANAIVEFTLFRYYGATGIPDPEADWIFEAHRDRGNLVHGVMLDRALPKSAALIEAEQYQYISYLTDTPKPQEEMTGFIKAAIKGLPQEFAFHGEVGAAA